MWLGGAVGGFLVVVGVVGEEGARFVAVVVAARGGEPGGVGHFCCACCVLVE